MNETPEEPEQPDDDAGDDAPAPPRRRRTLFRRRQAEAAAPAELPPELDDEPDETEASQTEASAAAPTTRAGIKRDRKRLDDERREGQFHLGGLALEMYRRDVLGDPLLRERAAELIDLDDRVRLLDWRLEAIEAERRQRKGAEPAMAGSCLSCGADFAPAAQFCWSCGVRFAPETEAQSALTPGDRDGRRMTEDAPPDPEETVESAEEPPDEPGRTCATCGSPLDPAQLYCLECGSPSELAPELRRPRRAGPLVAAGLIGLGLVGGAAAFAIVNDDDEPRQTEAPITVGDDRHRA